MKQNTGHARGYQQRKYDEAFSPLTMTPQANPPEGLLTWEQHERRFAFWRVVELEKPKYRGAGK